MALLLERAAAGDEVRLHGVIGGAQAGVIEPDDPACASPPAGARHSPA
ncbi:hypothetical protein GIY62_00385 [Burkholderia plantarii]|nr:hypothetical protein [Burkholderia plantarii]WLE59207.1 hypothetical protein GIY62_00385 [Burkholderia plantarii]